MSEIKEALLPLWNLRQLLHVDGRAGVMVDQSVVGEMLETVLRQVEPDLAGE